jgi:hypothetical protein
LASSPDLDGVTGGFFERRKEIPCQFRDQPAEERLWRRCEQLLSAGSAQAADRMART